MDLAVGQVYGEKYRIVRLLGQGSMGAVYEGENIRIRRKVAIKTLHQGMAEKGDTLQRFEREAQAAGRIGSQHIVEVLDMGDLPDGSRYMVMEHLEGTTLQQHIRNMGRVKPEEASPIVQQLLEGLGAAHAAGIIHRDLKPANVFLVRQQGRPNFVKILDFGVSKFSVLSEEMSMTRTGAVLGTPYYMSPEQAKGARGTDARSDVYAVGVILYECITGQVPFAAETFNELLFRIVLESPPPPESFVPDLSPALAAIIRKAMAREPNERFQTAEELKKALAEWSTKAEEEAEPNFDGLATLDHQTVMRNTPFPMQAKAQPPGLRAAQPSITASGTVMVEPREAPKPGLAALGTVIIDPSVASVEPHGPPNNGARGPSSPAQQTAQGPSAATPRAAPGHSPATQPLPQWPGPSGAAPNAAAPNAAAPFPPNVPAPPQNGAFGANPSQRASYPIITQDGAAPHIPFESAPPDAEAQTFLPPARKPNSLRAVAGLGIATGLLAGVVAWALLWRTTDDPQTANAALTAAVSAAAAPSTSDPSNSPAPTSSGESANSAASQAPSAEASSASATSKPIASADPPKAADQPVDPAPPAATSTATSAKSLAKPAPSASAKASSGPAEKPGKTNPLGGRTVTQDL